MFKLFIILIIWSICCCWEAFNTTAFASYHSIPYATENVGICIMTVTDLWNVCLGVFFFQFVFYLSAIQCWIYILSVVCRLNIWSKIWAPYELECVLFGAMNAPMTFNVSWESFSNNTSKCFPLLFGWCCYFRKANGSWTSLWVDSTNLLHLRRQVIQSCYFTSLVLPSDASYVTR